MRLVTIGPGRQTRTGRPCCVHVSRNPYFTALYWFKNPGNIHPRTGQHATRARLTVIKKTAPWYSVLRPYTARISVRAFVVLCRTFILLLRLVLPGHRHGSLEPEPTSPRGHFIQKFKLQNHTCQWHHGLSCCVLVPLMNASTRDSEIVDTGRQDVKNAVVL